MGESVNMLAAMKELARRSARLTVFDFGPFSVRIFAEDGSSFFIKNSFMKKWKDEDDQEWLFVFCEHYPDMVFDIGDLISYEEWAR